MSITKGTTNERTQLNNMLQKLADIDSELSEIVSDYQQQAECEPGFESHHKTDEGEPICLPEDANPVLDGVRVHIDEAMTEIRDYLTDL